jgi:hypothetical protein
LGAVLEERAEGFGITASKWVQKTGQATVAQSRAELGCRAWLHLFIALKAWAHALISLWAGFLTQAQAPIPTSPAGPACPWGH